MCKDKKRMNTMNGDVSVWLFAFHSHVNKGRQIYCLGKSRCETGKEKGMGT